MKMLLPALLSTLVAFNASAISSIEEPTEKSDSLGGFVFTDIKTIPTTSVKDQNKSGTCWCFAGTSFYEDEITRKGGKPEDMSEMFTVRQCYLDKADRYIRMDGATNFAAGGSILDVPYVWDTYGAITEEAYPGIQYGEDKHIHNELDAVLRAYLDAVKANPNKRISTAWRKGFEAILDAYLGAVPETFTVNGKTYTPKSYAAALGLKGSDYVALSSFSHHPFYSPFVLEVADNWLWGQYQNLPLDEFKAVIDNALENGYPVVWAADVSEGGFNWKKGYAVMPKPTDEASLEGTELARWVTMSDADRQKKQFEINGPTDEIEVTQQSRQDMFDRHETTDDHGMELVGIATDQNGNRFYKVKNSWDTNQVYGGFFYVSEPYVLSKTLSILVNKNAIPKDIAKKLNLK